MAQPRSYDLKVDRAEQHLIDLEFEIWRYARLHPYHVRVGVQNQRKVHRFEFLQQPDPHLSVLVGDFLYNIHSALNHLAASLVPSQQRSSVAFPIFWQGVWGPPVEGENKQRTKDRKRWRSYTAKMPDDAVAIIKTNQPPDVGPNTDNTHALAILSRLRNADAHSRLTVVSSTLVRPIVRCVDSNGDVSIMRDPTFGAFDGLTDHTEINGIPEDSVDVQIEGTPKVTIRVGKMQGGVAVGEAFRDLLLNGARGLIELLRPYDRR